MLKTKCLINISPSLLFQISAWCNTKNEYIIYYTLETYHSARNSESFKIDAAMRAPLQGGLEYRGRINIFN